MKLKAAQVENFLRAPDAKAQLVLIYGEDEGLVRERAVRLAKTVVEDLKDPFRVIELGTAQLKEDASRLRDEAAAISFGGGRRVIRIRDISEAQAPVIADFLADPAGDALIVIEAGSLASKSKLRQTVEKAGNGMALPCYADSGRDIEALINSVMEDHKLRIDRDAIRYLVGNLGSDRMISRSELEKLALYALKEGQVTLADAMSCVGDSSARHYDDVVQAVSQGNVASLDSALTRLVEEGLNPVGALRMMIGYFQKLHLVKGQIAQGTNAEQAMKSLRPPLFFKAADQFRANLQNWALGNLQRALQILLEAEKDCKSGLAIPETIAHRAMIKVAVARQKQGRR
ncbi:MULTISPECIES: DNA polymerase III subunit delta [Thalassospira]|jgi:DNA polymerase-3 subunit delta|uniref:DNA-directed DNA polymerase n=1 Tax=Thalassospira xiamenensis TaxID=220697 RepID=A0ABR5Y076_9PROT|nr:MULTISPECIES: DNA polymerase III subunit delta [Thalassospira]KZD01753.1 DNA polymerase III subunit delta [Thalassospira xiamenensis]KZD11236.1 DNA polymerase III subunit delta [Thalassospira xiamenensis]MAB32602.1 DNA polymerase III subunit delta [Thalassospira sp.]MBA06468.1 DNA polymerase III subunit delta [Thalassospira sp.]MCD1592494.1 DNA polymerase III subunit delta [Thalassospira xiamenensis]|tara:strand:- start:1296 stop:2327 length:1032 start_codon:yes stop_codon:yes gene_type:complete